MVAIVVAFVHDRQRQAGIDALAVDQHGAGAALALVAPFLGAGQMQMLAQRVEQGRPRVEVEFADGAVDREGYLHIGGDSGCGGLGIRRRRLGMGCRRHSSRSRAPNQQVTPG